jgi:hypothetical protein
VVGPNRLGRAPEYPNSDVLSRESALAQLPAGAGSLAWRLWSGLVGCGGAEHCTRRCRRRQHLGRWESTGAAGAGNEMFFGAIFSSMKPINLPRQARDKHKTRNVEAKKAISILYIIIIYYKYIYYILYILYWRSLLCRRASSSTGRYASHTGTAAGTWESGPRHCRCERKTAHALF